MGFAPTSTTIATTGSYTLEAQAGRFLNVTCVHTDPTPPPPPSPGANNSKPDTSSKIQKMVAQQSSQRVQALITNQMGSSRQVDRLMDFGSGSGNAGSGVGGTSNFASGFTAEEQQALEVASNGVSAPRLGLGAGGGSNVPLSQSLGLRPGLSDESDDFGRTGPGGGYGRSGGSVNVAGLNIFGSADGGANFNFSTSLRDVARAAQQQEAQRLADDPNAAALGFTGARGRAMGRRANPLDVWIEGRFVQLNDGRNGADLHGSSGLFGAGVDYVFTPGLLAGISLSYDTNSQKSTAQGMEARGNGWLVGPYATLRLAQNLYLQSRAAWGRASNDVSPDLVVRDSFESQRWLMSSKLVGRYQVGALQIRPSASVSYMEETSESYTSATGAAIASTKTRAGSFSMGPEFSYQMRVASGVLMEPRIGMDAIWTFARDISVNGNSGLIGAEAVAPDGVRGRVELGLRTMMTGGVVVDLSGSYDGIGAGDYNVITGRSVLRVPLN